MTCVLSSPWQPFSASYEWSPMHPGGDIATGSGYDGHQQGYASSESESKPVSNSSGKKRASRAGTRSVTTLSAAQLERKRANDREAQRAIRQRTKEHIDTLERSISDLRANQEASEKVIAATQQRNRDLEEENAYLKTRLSEAGYPINSMPSEHRNSATSLQPEQQMSGSRAHRSNSNSTSQSGLSLGPSQPQNGSWQQTPQSDFGSAAAPTPMSLPGPGPAPVGPPLTAWRPQESPHGIQDPSQGFQHPQYSVAESNDRTPWQGAPQGYPLPDQQRPVEQAPQPQQQYQHPPVTHYAAAPGPQQPVYHSPTAPNQAQFQNMAVASPTSYPVPQQQPFTQYQMAPMQVSSPPTSAVYAPQQVQMEAQPLPPPPYHAPQPEQQYQQPPMHQQIPFRQDSSGRTYSLTHYPSG